MMKAAWLALFLFTGVFAYADQILVLSGGGSPEGNHYSQYLQTKTLADDMRARFPAAEPSVLFGAGNAEGQEPRLADVHRISHDGNLKLEEMIVGAIAGNSPATKDGVESYFKQPRLSRMGRNETFFLLVSDHGFPYVDENGNFDLSFENNCIDLWGFQANLKTGQYTDNDAQNRCLSKNDLRSYLDKNVSAGRVVFAMSQCYSGGFHKMSVTTAGKYPTANPRICGFTAVTEDTTASGCTADVDGPSYQGYERSFTEQLTGLDVVNGKRLRPARASLQEAHREAVTEDMTKDIPLSTSDFYLWKWAQTISSKNFATRTGASANEARVALVSTNIGLGGVQTAAYREKDAFFARARAATLKAYPEYQKIFEGPLTAHLKLSSDLSTKMTEVQQSSSLYSTMVESSQDRLMNEWSKQVRAGKVKLTAQEVKLERDVFGRSEMADGGALLLLSMKGITDPQFAKSLSVYMGKREGYAAAWAEKSPVKSVRDDLQTVKGLRPLIADLDAQYTDLEKRQGQVRRILIYREVLGAWAALEKMRDQQALRELDGLLECEATRL